MSQRDLTLLCERLLAAEAKHAALKTYCDNLPADRQYDLKLSVGWAWESSGYGYKEMQREIQKRVAQEHRVFMAEALVQAEQDANDARRNLLDYNPGEKSNA